jgi:hypothetical protein
VKNATGSETKAATTVRRGDREQSNFENDQPELDELTEVVSGL